MLGEQITEVKGKIMGSRVLYAEGPTIEAIESASVNIRGTPTNESRTFIAKPLPAGVLHGRGQGGRNGRGFRNGNVYGRRNREDN